MTPEQLHNAYTAQVSPFLAALPDPGLRTLFRQQGDPFFRRCALALWQAGGAPLTPAHGGWYNALYTGPKPQETLFWDMVSQGEETLPLPPFLPRLLAYDRTTGRQTARAFLDLLAGLLPLLAGADGGHVPPRAAAAQAYWDGLFTQWQQAGLPGNPAPTPLDFPAPAPGAPPASPDPTPAPGQDEPAPPQPAPKQAEAADPQPTLEELLAQLDALVGLEGVKAEVHSLVNLMKVRRLREAAGLPTPPLSLHLVFVGNPGTGKTTVARLIGQLYRAIGILSQGQLVEVDRSGLVAGYVGQTALKTQEVLQSALGGVLFLDEAYALAPASPTDYGREAIEVLLKGMEDHRKDLVVIAAGYPEPMEDFLHSNPGLASRFPKTLVFADYTPPQLLAIFQGLCRKNGYTLPPETEAAAAARFQALYAGRDAHFGNARTARNTFEDAVARQADRVAALEAPSREDLMALLPQDLAGA